MTSRPTDAATELAAVIDRVRRGARRRRRPLAAALAAVSVLLVTQSVADTRATTPVLVAATDLVAGHAMTPGDWALVDIPRDLAPSGTFASGEELLDRLLAGPVREGEPLTDARLVGSSLAAAAGDGMVAAPVRLDDPETATLVRQGDLVDVLAADDGGLAPPTSSAGSPASTTQPPDPTLGSEVGAGVVLGADRQPPAVRAHATARVVAVSARVLSAPAPQSQGSLLSGSGGSQAGAGLLLLAVPPEVAAQLAAAAATEHLSIVLLS